MTMTSHLILLAMLCCAVGCAAAGDKQFGCMYDQVAWNRSAMPARIVESENSRGKVKGATMSADAEEWEPIRFTVFTEDIQSRSQYCTASGEKRPTFIAPSDTDTCKKEDILTKKKKTTLLNDMIPAAVKLHSDRLLVQRVTGNIIVPRYTEGPCATLTIPTSHTTEGVSKVDMILYVAAGPTEYPKAWAGTCSIAPYTHRPVVGAMNVGPSMIRTGNNGVRVVAHEIAHALGFSIQNMHSLNMVTKVQNIRGLDRLVVSSAVTLEKAKAHYKCDNLPGMELENEGDGGIIHSHWERRNSKDELMASITEAGLYTALTLSAFESMGYYRANWSMEETMEWGRNKGCPFLEGRCVSNGQSNYPDMFCTDASSTSVCTFARRGLGNCALEEFVSPLPYVFRYFNDPKLGGASPFLDFCPVVVQYANTGCKDGNESYMPGSRVGPNSLCLKGEGLEIKGLPTNAVQDICAEISCENNIVRVRYAGDNDWHRCPEGRRIIPKGNFTAGTIECPIYEEVCGKKKIITVTRVIRKVDNNVQAVTSTSTSLNNTHVSLERTRTKTYANDGTQTSNTRPIPKKFSGESSTAPGKMVTKDASDGNSKTFKKPSSVKPVKKHSPEENDVKNSDGSLSALPVINGTKVVNPTKVKRDSSQFSNSLCGRFVPLCACFIYIFALCWAF